MTNLTDQEARAIWASIVEKCNGAVTPAVFSEYTRRIEAAIMEKMQGESVATVCESEKYGNSLAWNVEFRCLKVGTKLFIHPAAPDPQKIAAPNFEGMATELLCITHRDGGHYIVEHGLQKAFEDACEKLHRWKQVDDYPAPQPVNEELLAAAKEVIGTTKGCYPELEAAILKAEQQTTAPECPNCAELADQIVDWMKMSSEKDARIKELEQENERLNEQCASEHEGRLDAMALVLNHEGYIEKLQTKIDSITAAFYDRVKIIEMQLEDKKELQAKIDELEKLYIELRDRELDRGAREFPLTDKGVDQCFDAMLKHNFPRATEGDWIISPCYLKEIGDLIPQSDLCPAWREIEQVLLALERMK